MGSRNSRPIICGMNAALMPIIDATTLAYALDDLLNEDIETTRHDLRDLRRILANLPSETVRTELDDAIVRWLKTPFAGIVNAAQKDHA